VSGISSSQSSRSQLGLSQVKREEGEGDAEHPTSLLVKTSDSSADEHDLQSDDSNQPVIPSTVEIDEFNKPLNYDENSAQIVTSFLEVQKLFKRTKSKIKRSHFSRSTPTNILYKSSV